MWETTLALFVLALIAWFRWRKMKMSLFKRVDIPGPTPGVFFGNYLELVRKGDRQCFNEWIEKYGKVFGYYHGVQPILVVGDLDIIETIMVKEFQHYSDKLMIDDIGVQNEERIKYSIVAVNGQKWKHLRRIITPMFSPLKLKMTTPIMQQAVEELVDAVEREYSKGRPFNIQPLYAKLTIDVIARTTLGLHTRAQEDAGDTFCKFLPLILMDEYACFRALSCSFPELRWAYSVIWKIINRLRVGWKQPGIEIDHLILDSIRARQEDPKNRRKDLLQFLIDSSKMGDNVNHRDLTPEQYNNFLNGEKTDKDTSKGTEKLSTEDVVQNSITMLIAGFETTGNALGFTTHLLAHHQNIQDEVREEIRSLLSENGEISYETIQNMHCLDQVIVEALRFMPPAISAITRKGKEDIVIKGKKIPKEATLLVPIYHIHHDPELWEEPEKYNPYRWSPEKRAKYHPMNYQAFGIGSRSCPGKKFAYLEMKLALAKLLEKYKFLPAPGAKEDLEFISHFGIVHSKTGIIVEAQKI